MDLSDVVVCSFYTADDYYRSHADRLRKNLSDIGVQAELEEIEKEPGQDWADICRKKISFLGRVCDENPDKRVFWIDVDCQLLDLPSYVAGFTSDLIGFQRGFGSPMTIGYATRTRFWEPCFFGINTGPNARKFMADAVALEKNATIKATDDYFFEESWRANAASMSFQVIPSGGVTGRSGHNVTAFFTFGSSGNVAEFKGKVVQHDQVAGVARRGGSARKRALRLAKAVERRLGKVSGRLTRRLRRVADGVGITHALTSGNHETGGSSRHRQTIVNQMVASGQRGELEKVRELAARLNASAIPTANEAGAQKAAESFAHYALENGEDTAIPLSWWARPFPGNFGDWLSPLILQSASSRPVRYVTPTVPHNDPHLIMVGSIGRFIRGRSIVVGTGISTTDVELNPNASYHSVRGPLTAGVLAEQGGPTVESTGDPGALLSRLLPVERAATTNGRIALVRHFTHLSLPITVPENMDEISVLRSHPDDIREFVEKIAHYDAVVTSAMHVMIVCHSYGIPCTLVSFSGFEDSVHGSGIKYRDYYEGAGLSGTWEPVGIDLNLNRTNFDDLIRQEQISGAKMDEIEQAIAAGVDEYLRRTA